MPMRKNLGQAVMGTRMVKRLDLGLGFVAASSLSLVVLGAGVSSSVAAKKEEAKKEEAKKEEPKKEEAKKEEPKKEEPKKEEPKKDAKKEKGPVEEVADRYKQVRAPKKTEKDQAAGMVVLNEGDCRSFAKDFLKAGEKDKNREVDAIFNAGVVYDQCGLDKDAESMYRQALGKNPKFQPAMNNLAVLHQKVGQSQAALQEFEAAIKVNPSGLYAVQAYNNRAALLFEKIKQSNSKAVEEAIGAVRRALALDAESMAAYQLLAQIYFYTAESDRSKLALAQLVLDEAKKIDENYAPVYNTLGLIKLKKNDKTGALTEFRKAVAIDPSMIEAQLNIAAISLSSRNYKQAEDAFAAVLKKLPNHFEATMGMGVALRGQRKVAEAETWYQKALQLDPKNCGALYNLGLLYQDYKSGSPDDMNKGKDYYNKYVACEHQDKEHSDEAKRRVKDIDDTFKALEEQKKLEAELKAQQAEMERMQKLQEEQMKKYEEEQKKQQGGAGGAAPAGGAPPAAGAPAAGGDAKAPDGKK